MLANVSEMFPKKCTPGASLSDCVIWIYREEVAPIHSHKIEFGRKRNSFEDSNTFRLRNFISFATIYVWIFKGFR